MPRNAAGQRPAIQNGITGTRTKAEIRRELADRFKSLADVPAPDEMACRRLLALLTVGGGADDRAQ